MTENVPRFTIVPYERMDELMEKIDKLSATLLKAKKHDKGVLGDYIPEKDAKQLLSKATTWFWNKRKSGELTGRKAGNQWYYKESDILNFIEKSSPQNKTG